MTPIILASRLCSSCATATKKCDVLIIVSSHYRSCCRCRCTPDVFPTSKMLRRRIHRHGVTAAPAAIPPRRRCSPAASPRGGPQLAQQRVAVGAVSPRFRPLLRVHPPQRLQLLVRLLVQLQKEKVQSAHTVGWGVRQGDLRSAMHAAGTTCCAAAAATSCRRTVHAAAAPAEPPHASHPLVGGCHGSRAPTQNTQGARAGARLQGHDTVSMRPRCSSCAIIHTVTQAAQTEARLQGHGLDEAALQQHPLLGRLVAVGPGVARRVGRRRRLVRQVLQQPCSAATATLVLQVGAVPVEPRRCSAATVAAVHAVCCRFRAPLQTLEGVPQLCCSAASHMQRRSKLKAPRVLPAARGTELLNEPQRSVRPGLDLTASPVGLSTYVAVDFSGILLQ